MTIDLTREKMIQFIAEEWTDNIDIKSYLQHMFYKYSDQLNDWTDKDIETEYKELFDND